MKNTIRILVITFFIFLLSKDALAQYEYLDKPSIRYIHSHNKVWMAGGLYYNGRYGAHSTYYKLIKPGEKSPWTIGGGLGGTFFYANDKLYTTASYSELKGSKSPLAITNPTDEAKMDTLMVGSTFMLPVNFQFIVCYRYSNKWEFYLHLDLGGITLGAPAKAVLYSSKLNEGIMEVNALPTFFNYTLPGPACRGSLIYQLGSRFWITHKYAVFVSMNFLVSEFSAKNQPEFLPSRYRNSSPMLMAGLCYAPFYNKTK